MPFLPAFPPANYWIRNPYGNRLNIRDPWGSVAEYFFDLDHSPELCASEPHDFPEQDALYRWGTEPAPHFGEHE